MKKLNFAFLSKLSKRQWFVVIGVIVVVLVVLFSRQIGDLLNLFPSKAGTGQQIEVNVDNFLQGEAEGTNGKVPAGDVFKVEGGKLMLK